MNLEARVDQLIDRLIRDGRGAAALEMIERALLARGQKALVAKIENEINEREPEAPPEAKRAIDQHQAKIEPVLNVPANPAAPLKPRLSREERRAKQAEIGREFMKSKLYKDVMAFANSDRGFGPATFIDGASMREPSEEEKAAGKKPSFRMIRLPDFYKQFAAADTPELQAFALKLGLETAERALGTHLAPAPWRSYILMTPTPRVKVGESRMLHEAMDVRQALTRVAEILMKSGVVQDANSSSSITNRGGGIYFGDNATDAEGEPIKDYSDVHVTGFDPKVISDTLKQQGIDEKEHDALMAMIDDIKSGKLRVGAALKNDRLKEILGGVGFAALAGAKAA